MCLEFILRNARSVGLMAVETCSKALFGVLSGHGKSPCLLRCGVYAVVGVDSAGVDFAVVDVGKIME